MAQKIVYSAKFKRNYVALSAVLLFLLMIIGEVVLAVSIPVYMQRENVLAEQVLRRNMLLRFDNIRRYCNRSTGDNEILQLELQMLADPLDKLAIYLRNESGRLTPEEVRELDALTIELQRIAIRLASGKTYSSESRLDSSAYIDTLVKKYSGEAK